MTTERIQKALDYARRRAEVAKMRWNNHRYSRDFDLMRLGVSVTDTKTASHLFYAWLMWDTLANGIAKMRAMGVR